MNPAPRWVAVGRITKAHGVKGEVSVLVLSQVAERFEPGSRLYLGESEGRPLTVSEVRPYRQRLLVRFEGVTDRNRAEELQGLYLFVPVTSAPTLPEGEFWTHQLIGCEVVTDSGRSLGRIREVIRTTANDVWATESEGGEVLIPALREVVEAVDLQGGRVVVHEIPGLTSP